MAVDSPPRRTWRVGVAVRTAGHGIRGDLVGWPHHVRVGADLLRPDAGRLLLQPSAGAGRTERHPRLAVPVAGTVATLGFGDIVPTSPSLRLVAPLEALVGFFLLTAAVSWIVQIYPALARRRVLALRLAMLRGTSGGNAGLVVDDIPAGTLIDLANGVAQVRVDLIQYSATYYFREMATGLSFSAMLGYAADLAGYAAASEQRDTRLAGAVLIRALDDLADGLNRGFLRIDGDTRTVLRAYAADQEQRTR